MLILPIMVLERWDSAHLMAEMVVDTVVLFLWVYLQYLRCRTHFSLDGPSNDVLEMWFLTVFVHAVVMKERNYLCIVTFREPYTDCHGFIFHL